MKNTNDESFILNWKDMHPYQTIDDVDVYYIEVAKQVHRIVEETHCDTTVDKIALSCVLASYLEDVVSGSLLWSLLTKACNEICNKPQPFANSDTYKLGDINIEDILYLKNMQESKSDNFCFDFFVDNLSEDLLKEIYSYLTEVKDDAPINPKLIAEYQVPTHDNQNFLDYYVLMCKLMFHSYLFYFDQPRNSFDQVMPLAVTTEHSDLSLLMQKELSDLIINIGLTKCLRMHSNDWLAILLGREHPNYEAVKTLKKRLRVKFFFKKEEGNYAYFTSLINDQEFKVNLYSLPVNYREYEQNIFHLGLTEWKSEWWVTGMFDVEDVTAESVDIELNLPDSLKQLEQSNKVYTARFEEFKEQYDSFMLFTGGKNRLTVSIPEFYDFIPKCIEFHNNREETQYKDLLFDEDLFIEIYKDHLKNEKEIMIFCSPYSGLELSFRSNLPRHIIKDKEEYEKFNEEAKVNFFFIVEKESSSINLREFAESNSSHTYFKDHTLGRFIQENLEFSLRFLRCDYSNYLFQQQYEKDL